MGSSGDLDGEVGPGELPDGGWSGLERNDNEGVRGQAEEAETFDVSSSERPRLADDGRAGLSGGDLEADGQIAGQQPKADRHLIGVEPLADQVGQIVTIDQLFEGLL